MAMKFSYLHIQICLHLHICLWIIAPVLRQMHISGLGIMASLSSPWFIHAPTVEGSGIAQILCWLVYSYRQEFPFVKNRNRWHCKLPFFPFVSNLPALYSSIEIEAPGLLTQIDLNHMHIRHLKQSMKHIECHYFLPSDKDYTCRKLQEDISERFFTFSHLKWQSGCVLIDLRKISRLI